MSHENMRVGWHPTIGEIPNFINQVMTRPGISDEMKDRLVSLNRDLERSKDMSSEIDRSQLQQEIIDKALEIDSDLPKTRIRL